MRNRVNTPDLLATPQAEVALLAEAWLAAGATEFCLAANGVLRVWGCSAPGAPSSVAVIQQGMHQLGQLRVSGIAGGWVQRRLEADAQVLTRLAGQEHALTEMTSELIEAQDQLLAFYDLTRATRSQLGLGEVLRLLAGEAARLVRAESALMLLNPLVVQHPQSLLADTTVLELFQRVRLQGHEIVLSNEAAHSLAPGLHNLCLLPVYVRGQITSALGLLNKAQGFSAPDLKLARAIAEQAGSLIEHALLHAEQLAQARLQAEMELARNVQLQMLPRYWPAYPGLDIFAESRPAREVGGDFYDFVAQPDRPLIAILGDVSGKGMSAALIMGMIHAITNSAARFMPYPTPAAVLARANEDLYDDFTTLDTFATAFVAAYSSSERELRYANAGHAPVIYRPAGGAAYLLEADGVPIGVLPMSLCETQSVPFGPGDLLVIATDGFSEASNLDDQMLGYERLLELVDGLADRTAEQIGRALFGAVQTFAAGHPQDDDQTLIVLKGVGCGHDI